MSFDAQWRQAARNRLPRLLTVSPAQFDALHVDAAAIDRLLAAGVPFHMAGDRQQDERPRVADAAKRLAAGETLYLVQPHEYMPRLRRFLHQRSREAGFLGRPARTFLFRVAVPGREAMGMHDDGNMDLAWVQLEGERFVTFGTQYAKGRKRALRSADGKTAGWFQGGQPAGTFLYLPPWSPHEVRCRKPSIAVSIYWEQVSPEEALVDLAGAVLDPRLQRTLPTDRQLDAVLVGLAKASAARKEWRALKATEDGGRDAPLDPAGDWEDPQLWISAWRAMSAWREGRDVKLAAGGEAVLQFPPKSLGALEILSGYGEATRAELQRKCGLRPRELTRLLEVLSAEGLIVQGELPAVGKFQAEDLSGWEYVVEE
jgi:hypothetical protein